MAEKTAERTASVRQATEADCLVSGKGPDDTITSVGPFSRERAEALVKVYGHLYPGQTWIEPLAPPINAFHSGVRRGTRIPHRLKNESDH